MSVGAVELIPGLSFRATVSCACLQKNECAGEKGIRDHSLPDDRWTLMDSLTFLPTLTRPRFFMDWLIKHITTHRLHGMSVSTLCCHTATRKMFLQTDLWRIGVVARASTGARRLFPSLLKDAL